MANRLERAGRFLRNSERTAELLSAIEGNRKLLQSILGKLPAPLDAHCLHASIDEGVLTLVTDSPVWGSRLRFFAPELTKALSSRYGPIENCRVRVRPLCTGRKDADCERPVNRLSGSTVRLLMDAADGLGETDLARALRRLAKAGAEY